MGRGCLQEWQQGSSSRKPRFFYLLVCFLLLCACVRACVRASERASVRACFVVVVVVFFVSCSTNGDFNDTNN